MTGPSVYTKIFGCQMNYSDAERIWTTLKKNNLTEAASADEADVVIYVTCGVRQSAEDRVYGQINNLRKKYPEKKIILTGCLAHRKDVQRRLKGKVDLFLPIKDIYKISNLRLIKNLKFPLKARLAGGGKNKNYQACNHDYLRITPRYSNLNTAYVPIMTGCNNFCAYCVVPYARGREYSRPAEEILTEIKNLVKKGYKEIILLGQNVNSYKGFYKNKAINFPRLLRLIEDIPAKRSEAPHQTAEGSFGARGNFWLTFLTSHPKDMSGELIETIAKSLSASGGQKICEYISLPAQSGDDTVLKKMNRHYTVAHYKNLIRKIQSAYKKYQPQIAPAISTDIIVGFPGETKKQFENTAKLLREMKFDMAYISQYSPRPETAAWKLKDNVSKREKVRRDKVLTEILKKTALKNNKKYVGKVIEVLVNKESLPAEALAKAGHTRTQKKVIFHSKKKNLIGKFVRVKIIKAKAFGLEGLIAK